jgi:hypothetical protein
MYVVIPGACEARTRNPSGNTFCGGMDSGFAPRGAPRNDGEIYAGAAAVRTAGTGRNVIMIRNAPRPMIQEPM